MTSSWVKFMSTSYTVRSIMKLELKTFRTPRPAKYALFFFSLVLVVYTGVVVRNEMLPEWVGKSLLGASLVVFAIVFVLVFLKRTYYHVSITMFDGTHASHKRYDQAVANALHEAISHAMYSHQGNSGAEQGPMIATLASRRKAAKKGAWATKKMT